MVGKRVQFDEETWAVVNLLRQERRRSFQQLADEALDRLLAEACSQLVLHVDRMPVLHKQIGEPALDAGVVGFQEDGVTEIETSCACRSVTLSITDVGDSLTPTSRLQYSVVA